MIYHTISFVNMLLSAGIVSLLVLAFLLFAGREEGLYVRKIALRDLSSLWTRGGTRTIHIAELSPLWRDTILAAELEEPVDFVNHRTEVFMEKFIQQAPWFRKAPLQKKVCRHILGLLDREGSCPSVVRLDTDVEGNWDDNTFQVLARTTLLDHSLNVAEQVVRILSEAEACHVIPDTMVAALGHDLGKLESMRGYLYSLGEHPLAAGRPLAGLTGFKELPKKEEISRAIKLHHKSVDGLLGKTLKRADQLARQKELEEIVERLQPTQGSVFQEDTPGKPVTTLQSQPPPMPVKATVAKACQARADIYGEEATARRKIAEVPALLDISRWFDADAFLDSLKPYINRMFGRRFMAFSMADGHVYFQVKVLEEVARKQAERAGDMEIATMAATDTTMRRVLFSIVQHLRMEKDVIDRGLVKDTFFGGYFTVTRKIGKPIKGYYTPFHAEAFGSIAEMEQAKSDTLRNLRNVTPSVNKEATG